MTTTTVLVLLYVVAGVATRLAMASDAYFDWFYDHRWATVGLFVMFLPVFLVMGVSSMTWAAVWIARRSRKRGISLREALGELLNAPPS